MSKILQNRRKEKTKKLRKEYGEGTKVIREKDINSGGVN